MICCNWLLFRKCCLKTIVNMHKQKCVCIISFLALFVNQVDLLMVSRNWLKKTKQTGIKCVFNIDKKEKGRTKEKIQKQPLADVLQNMLLEVRRSLWFKSKMGKWCFIIFSLSGLITVSVKFRQSLTLDQSQNYRCQVWMEWKEKG